VQLSSDAVTFLLLCINQLDSCFLQRLLTSGSLSD